MPAGIAHSVSLGTDHPLANHNPAIFSVLPGTEKPIKSSKKTNSHDNSNLWHMFNNTTYTDFRTTYKHVLIPGCYLNDLIEAKCHRNINWLFG